MRRRFQVIVFKSLLEFYLAYLAEEHKVEVKPKPKPKPKVTKKTPQKSNKESKPQSKKSKKRKVSRNWRMSVRTNKEWVKVPSTKHLER